MTATPTPLEQRLPDALTAHDTPWVTIVWDDPINLMSYVTYVFMRHFGYDRERSTRLMMQVHTEGRAAVSHGPREQMERDVEALHGYGLWATLSRAEA